MSIEYIDVYEPKHDRKTSIGYNYKRGMPGCLRIVGGLEHNTDITFDRRNAIKLAKWLDETIINPKR